mmetsp:Transcript_22238/g.73177  ORF Transcript_22238/g.73177 Transcript_22238/m.73177 type:complete len:212 (-) Transcript_22238:274-909(-)
MWHGAHPATRTIPPPSCHSDLSTHYYILQTLRAAHSAALSIAGSPAFLLPAYTFPAPSSMKSSSRRQCSTFLPLSPSRRPPPRCSQNQRSLCHRCMFPSCSDRLHDRCSDRHILYHLHLAWKCCGAPLARSQLPFVDEVPSGHRRQQNTAAAIHETQMPVDATSKHCTSLLLTNIGSRQAHSHPPCRTFRERSLFRWKFETWLRRRHCSRP